MARISELHYSNAYAASSGVAEFLEVALGPMDDPADFTVSFYQSDGTTDLEITLDDPGVQVTVDADNGEVIYVISADHFDIRLTDPDGGGPNNYEAYALTESGDMTIEVIDFYDIGGGTQNITAVNGIAAGAVSENLPVLTGPNSTTTTLQFNQPDPGTLVNDTIDPGDSGPACFVAGTLIDTPDGPRRVETLRPGMQLLTCDHGAQTIRWIGRRQAPGRGRFAPVRIAQGMFGAQRDIWVSPQHRILVTGWQAEMFFGASEILVPAKALVDGRNVRRVECDMVSYFHLLLDRHEILTASGMPSESFFPGDQALSALGATAHEVFDIFPNLASNPAGYGKTARPVLGGDAAGVLRVA